MVHGRPTLGSSGWATDDGSSNVIPVPKKVEVPLPVFLHRPDERFTGGALPVPELDWTGGAVV